MSSPDFGHTVAARDNRHRKARQLRLAMVHHGITVEAGWQLIDLDAGDPDLRKTVRKTARLSRDPSRETWTEALVELERRPAVIVDVTTAPGQAPCGCWPAADTGVLYEFPPTPHGPFGWSCPHADTDLTGVRLCGPKAPTAGDAAVVREFAAELQHRADLEAAEAIAAADDPEPEPPIVEVAEPDEPWWA